MESLSNLLKVHVDFDRSHLLFPTIIEWVLGILLLAIIVVHGREVLEQWRASGLRRRIAQWQVDRKRLFGCLALTLVYFAAMEPVGQVYPNAGVGFLVTSIAYGLLLSWLFVHGTSRRKWVLISLNSVLTPLVVWLVFSHVFRITLP